MSCRRWKQICRVHNPNIVRNLLEQSTCQGRRENTVCLHLHSYQLRMLHTVMQNFFRYHRCIYPLDTTHIRHCPHRCCTFHLDTLCMENPVVRTCQEGTFHTRLRASGLGWRRPSLQGSFCKMWPVSHRYTSHLGSPCIRMPDQQPHISLRHKAGNVWHPAPKPNIRVNEFASF